MSDKLHQLTDKLKELFQLNRPDLDFGFYRIMHAKQAEIEQFLEKDLLPQVKEGLAALGNGKQNEIKAQIDTAIKQAKDLGVDKPEETKKVRELMAEYGSEVDAAQAEEDIYSHLYNFFARYYHDGDFMSMRRYKEGVYSIPYEGEEVYLHWANKDQYYIKTSENLTNYTFKLDDDRKVTFRILEADTEKDNKKAAGDKDRRFIFNPESIKKSEDGKVLVIGFEYRPDEKKRTQKTLIEECVKHIQDNLKEYGEFSIGLLSLKPTEKNKNRTLLEKHLADYTAKHTFDYFIHKDLGKFLKRELDFYIKNEVMHLDDIEHENAPRVEQYLTQVKVIRKIASKIIAFLAQLENFQKKLWLKKKFVVETNYCITLDRVPEELYPEIAANDVQREEWVKLFAIDEIKEDCGELPGMSSPGYSIPLTTDFLKANDKLVLDTRFFDNSFKDQLLKSIESLDEHCSGLLVHSENFQALNLLQERYREQVKCVYIDPPYNTGGDGFPYKDGYQHSSWSSMLLDRLNKARTLMSDDAIISSSIDDHEVYRLGLLFDEVMGDKSLAACAPWRSEPSGGKEKTGLRTGHEYLLMYYKTDSSNISQDERSTGKLNLNDSHGPYRKGRELRKWGGTSLREDRPKQFYALPAPDGSLAYPVKNDGKEGHWRWGKDNPNIKIALSDSDFFHWEKTSYDAGIAISGETERWTPYEKIRDIKKSVGWSTWLDSFGINADATRTLKELFGEKVFDTPKPIQLIDWFCNLHSDQTGIALDFYAGSGVLGQAIIDINRCLGERRKYILVEMGDYFNTVLKPRIQKVIYSSDWKDGKPIDFESGVSHCFKYIRLESYEDCLNNLQLSRSEAQDDLLLKHDDLREDYMLNYMLDVEAKGSILNIDGFEEPFAYKMNIATGTVGETKPVNVDLVETFNYLIGLKVKQIDTIRGVRVITGENLAGERILVLWRKVKELDSDALDEWFRKQGYNTQDMEFDIIYVNGDNNLENLKKDEETWKVRLIEEDFQRLMFEGTE